MTSVGTKPVGMWIAGALAIGAGLLAAAPAEAQPYPSDAVRIGRSAVEGGVVFGPGGLEVWVRTGRRAGRAQPPGRSGRYVDRDVRRAYERYDRDVRKATEKYERDLYKAEDRYYRRGDRRRYERDLFKAEEKYERSIFRAEHRLAEALDRAHYRRRYPD